MLQRLLELTRKTGDRLVAVEGDSGIVLLPLERYEELLGGVREVVRYPIAGDQAGAAVEDRIEVANEEVASLRGETDKVDDIKAVFDGIQGEGEPGEEQFYLEPVE